MDISLTALAREQLEMANASHSGRSSTSVHGGHEHRLRQTIIAPAAGSSLQDRANPGEATVYVLTGRALLHRR